MFRSTFGPFVLALALAGTAAAQNPFTLYQTSSSLATEYRDMGAAIAQVQTVERIPFFRLTPQERVARFSTYGTELRSGKVSSAARVVGQDFKSGLVKDISTIFLTDVLTRVARGDDMEEAFGDAVKGMTSKEFLVGNLLGGTLGAAMGSAVPVPALPGMAGQMMGRLPMLAGAMLGTRVGVNLVQGKAAFEGIQALEFISQSVGSTVGMVVGGMLPVPTLGPIVGGAIGGTAGLKTAAWLRGKFAELNPLGRVEAAVVSGETGGSVTEEPGPASASPAAPADELASLDPGTLRRKSDDLYRAYVRAAATGDTEGAATTQLAYRRVREALSATR